MSALRTEDLYKAFGQLVVTNNVNLTIEPGERHAIIGPNGAGKTSLLNQIGGQIQPTRGRIFLKDTEITGQSPEAVSAKGLARTFQRNNLFPGLAAIENVRLAVEIKRGNPLSFLARAEKRRDVMERARHILDIVHLGQNAARRVDQLSYGDQRQLEIAVALAGEPDVLLLDEPTAGMSQTETERMMELISGLPKSLSIVMIEHDMDVVFALADRITVLYYGEVLATGEPSAIRANQRVRDVYLGLGHR
jgi:branched-chain amino acid transport system ATP-binding protein